MDGRRIFNLISWLFQILIWFFLAGTIRNYSLDASQAAKLSFLILFLICYVVYFILELLSQEAKLLKKKTNEYGIFQKMGSYFKTYPVFELYCECFHFESTTDSPASHWKRTSYTETYKFPYYSERDMSGLLYIDCDNEIIKNKHYVQLELIEEINFADSISYLDYEEAKKEFIKKNKPKDHRFELKEKKYIPGLEKLILVKITDDEPCYGNFKSLVFFTIFMIGEFYKLLFNYKCIFQTYKIRKIVSTRYDLNQPEYQDFIPKIDVIIKKYNYEENYYNYINNEFKLNKPSTEELSRAKTINYHVPKYKIDNKGIVIDDPPAKKDKSEGNDKKNDNNLTVECEESDIRIRNRNNDDKIYNEKNQENDNKDENIFSVQKGISNNRRINNIPQSKTVRVTSERKPIKENNPK